MPGSHIKGDEMWKRHDVHKEKRYYLQLCEDSNYYRYFVLTEENVIPEDPFLVFVTEIVPHELLLSGDIIGIAETVRLADGHLFSVDAHGVWLTEQESKAFSGGVPFNKIPWLNGSPPQFAPK